MGNSICCIDKFYQNYNKDNDSMSETSESIKGPTFSENKQ